MVYAYDSKSYVRKDVRVQVSPRAHFDSLRQNFIKIKPPFIWGLNYKLLIQRCFGDRPNCHLPLLWSERNFIVAVFNDDFAAMYSNARAASISMTEFGSFSFFSFFHFSSPFEFLKVLPRQNHFVALIKYKILLKLSQKCRFLLGLTKLIKCV